MAALFCFPRLGRADFWWKNARVTDVKLGISAFIGGLKPQDWRGSLGRVCWQGKQGLRTPVTFRSQTTKEPTKDSEKEQ